MFFDERNKPEDDQPKELSLDLVGLVFIGVLLAIPLVLYLVAQ